MSDDLLTTVLQNDAAAVGMVRQMAMVTAARASLDDRETLLAASWAALVEIPSNRFYRAHEASLRPLIRQMLADIQAAKVLAAEGPHGQTIAFVLRDAMVGLIVQCVYLAGGYDAMAQYAPIIRREFQTQPLTDFLDQFYSDEPADESA